MQHTHCLAPVRANERADTPNVPSSYARLFPDLPTLTADQEFLFALGRSGGLCDCGDPGPSESLGSEAAGWPFFGQFLTHDITADRSPLTLGRDGVQLRNARSPQLNLECLYGDGPVGHPFLFQRADPAKLLTSDDAEDVLRNREGTAIIGDPRNDSHAIVSQLHLAFTNAHNAFVEKARAEAVRESEVFETAARELRWHYQTAILREFLPTLIGRELTESLLRDGCRYYRPTRAAFIPLEFADAAFRYGHSQIRHKYVLNSGSAPVSILPDLIGFRPVPAEHRIDWRLFFDVDGEPAAQRAKKIDGRMVHALIALPAALTGESEVEEFHSLAARDLQRGQRVGLPSGEAVARYLGEEPLTADEVGAAKIGWHGETPLWYYILREADVRFSGNRLGTVGARIVGEVLVGLLDHDPSSVRHAPNDWRCASSLVDLLTGAVHTAAATSP